MGHLPFDLGPPDRRPSLMGQWPVGLTTTRWPRPPSSALALSVVLLLVAGCGATGPRSTAGPTTTNESTTTTVAAPASPWSRPSPAIDAAHPITALSCPTTTFCMA